MIASESDTEIDTREDEGLISRWSRRKHEARENQAVELETATPATEAIEPTSLTDADMPPIESLTENSDYSGFLSPKVSETLRKQALRKLFSSPRFNFRDGLDDYDGIYTEFEKLGDIITADMRHQLEMESRRRLQQLAELESQGDDEQIDVAAISAELNEGVGEEQVVENTEIEQTVDQLDDTEVEP
jgi:hypothetical protein